MRARSRALVIGAATTVSLLTGAAVALSSAAPSTTDDTPPSLVETFDHPGADAIFQQRGIRLHKGDGNIVLADCRNGANQIKVESNAFDPPNHLFCFQVIGDKGHLAVEIPNAFLVYGNDRTTVATWSTDTGEVRNTTVPKNSAIPAPIGEGATGNPGVLIELNVTR